MKRVGPELKMPDLHAPAFLADIYWDLRERHLLPLIALIAVGIVAVPFLLGGGSDESVTELPGAAAGGGSALGSTSAAKFTVVEAKPGLRDYRRRLSHRSPTDPFVQRYATPLAPTGADQLNPIETSSGESTTVTVGGETSTGPAEFPRGEPSGGEPSGGEPSGGGPSGGAAGGTELTLFAFAIDVKVVRSGGKDPASGQKESRIEHGVLPQEPLPGKNAEVVTYMGISKKGRPLLLVSSGVDSVFGETKCVTGDEICQLIEVEPGFPAVFVYGANEVHYTVNVLKIEPVATGKTSTKAK